MRQTSREITAPSSNKVMYFSKVFVLPFGEYIRSSFLEPLYSRHLKPFYLDRIEPYIDLRKPDANAGFFAFFLGVSCLALLFAGNLSSNDNNNRINTQTAMQANLIDFAGFILDLPEHVPGERYKQAVRNLVLDNPEMLGVLKIQDVSFLFEKLSLSRRAGSSHMWQFASEHCVLDIYFVHTEGLDLADSKVEHFEIRSVNKVPLVKVFASGQEANSKNYAQSRCLKSIVREADYGGKTVYTTDYLKSSSSAG